MFIRRKKLIKILNDLAEDAEKMTAAHLFRAQSSPRGSYASYEASIDTAEWHGRAKAYDELSIMISKEL
jgi:hypothetical protein